VVRRVVRCHVASVHLTVFPQVLGASYFSTGRIPTNMPLVEQLCEK